MSLKTLRSGAFVGVLAGLTLTAACTQQSSAPSQTKVTEIPQTEVKRQSIGNCWAYAVTGWVESLHLMAIGEKINLSESYISYWASYYEIVWGKGKLEKLAEGGGWEFARAIILEHGLVMEGDFIPEEAEETFSKRQAKAVEYINEQLQPGGRLHGQEHYNDANIIKELDAAFGVDGLAAKARANAAKDLVVGMKDGVSADLESALMATDLQWNALRIPQEYNETEISGSVQETRLAIVRRVQRALNDKLPVLISFDVAMGLIDPEDGTFKLSRFTGSDSLGLTGGHMVVLTDYVVDDVPGVGSIGEGEVASEMKQAALEGKVRYFKAKNSWGTDRPERGLTDGYSRLELDYLFTNLPWPREEGKESVLSSSLREVILPPGY